jgi:glc operon protein GlcG
MGAGPLSQSGTGVHTDIPKALPYGPAITLEVALRVIERAHQEALARGWRMAFAVIDSTDHLVALHRMDGVHHGSIAVAQGKASTAVNFKRTSKSFEDAIAAGGAGLRLLKLEGMVPFAGGVPLLMDGHIVGAIGVSGVQSMEDDLAAQAGASVTNM